MRTPFSRRRHTRAQTWYQRGRRIRHWRRLLPIITFDGWTGPQEDGRLVKFTKSCDCCMCRLYREGTSFKAHKRAFYRSLDRIELAAQ